LEKHFQAHQTLNAGTVPAKSDDDVVIVAYGRTAMTKAKRGAQKDTACESMLTPVLKHVIQQAGIDPKLIEDVCIGNVVAPGSGAHTSRMAMFMAGIPETASL
jgi:acetyl-CoA acyltransferase 1